MAENEPTMKAKIINLLPNILKNTKKKFPLMTIFNKVSNFRKVENKYVTTLFR